MRRKKNLLFPTLRDRKGDITKKWYVELSMRDPQRDEMIRKRYECYDDVNINSFSSAAERYRLAEKIIAELKQKIAAGWTIF